MNVLVTSMKSESETIVANYQIMSDETDNIKHELVDVEDIEEKKGYSKELVYDKEQKKYKFEYRELPLTEEEKINEEVTKLKKALANVMAKNLNPSEEPTIPPEAEMAGLSEEDLLELNSIDPTSI